MRRKQRASRAGGTLAACLAFALGAASLAVGPHGGGPTRLENTPDLPISDPGLDSKDDTPALAFDPVTGRHLVVWHSRLASTRMEAGRGTTIVTITESIFAQRVDAVSGAQVGAEFVIRSQTSPSLSVECRVSAPAVAYNYVAEEFLVVYEAATCSEIRGRRIAAAAGVPIGADFFIGDSDLGLGENGDPALAYNGTNDQYLVVWDDGTEIVGQVVDGSDGMLIGPEITVSESSLDAERPAVAFSLLEDRYLVVWSGEEPDTLPFGSLAPDEIEIFGRLLDGSGGPQGATLRISQQGPLLDDRYRAEEPAIVYNPVQNQFLVVWKGDDEVASQTEGELEIFARRLDAMDAVPLDTARRISTMGDDLDTSFEAGRPAVAYSAAIDEYLVLWQGDDTVDDEFEVHGQRLAGSDAAELGVDDFSLSDLEDPQLDSLTPAVAFADSLGRHLGVWETEGTDSDRIYGQVIDIELEGDLAITKTDFTTVAIPGSTVSYTIVATNSGPNGAFGVQVTDTIPTLLEDVSWKCMPSSGSGCTAAGVDTLDETVDIEAGGDVTFTLMGTLPSDTPAGTLTNTVTLTVPADFTDTNPGNESDSDIDTIVPTADLSITKDIGLPGAVAGDPVTYTIVVENPAGSSDVTGLLIEDSFPASLLSVSWSCVGSGAVCPAANGSGDLAETADIPTGGMLTYTASATLDQGASGTLSNTAKLTLPAGFDDPDLGNNSATDSEPITSEADLSLAKSYFSTEDPPNPGSTVTYTLVATNSGPSAAAEVVLTDTFPSQLLIQSVELEHRTPLIFANAFESGDLSAWDAGGRGPDCALDGQTLTCQLGTFETGSTVTATVETIVDPATPDGTEIENSAAVTSTTTDPNPGGETPSVSFTVATGEGTTLSLTKTSSPNPVAQGAQLTYTLEVTNTGSVVATGVSLNDKFPFGFANPVLVDNPPEECTLEGNVLGCEIGILGILQTVTVKVRGTVATDLDLTNSASAGGDNTGSPVVATAITTVQ